MGPHGSPAHGDGRRLGVLSLRVLSTAGSGVFGELPDSLRSARRLLVASVLRRKPGVLGVTLGLGLRGLGLLLRIRPVLPCFLLGAHLLLCGRRGCGLGGLPILGVATRRRLGVGWDLGRAVVGIGLIRLDPGRGRCHGRFRERCRHGLIALVTIRDVFGRTARLCFLVARLAGGSLRLLLLACGVLGLPLLLASGGFGLLLLLASGSLRFLLLLASGGFGLLLLLASGGLGLLPLLASGSLSFLFLLASGFGFLFLLESRDLGLLALAASFCLCLLALAAGDLLGFLAVLSIGRCRPFVRRWSSSRRAS